jgi:hypothetical protein
LDGIEEEKELNKACNRMTVIDDQQTGYDSYVNLTRWVRPYTTVKPSAIAAIRMQRNVPNELYVKDR